MLWRAVHTGWQPGATRSPGRLTLLRRPAPAAAGTSVRRSHRQREAISTATGRVVRSPLHRTRSSVRPPPGSHPCPRGPRADSAPVPFSESPCSWPPAANRRHSSRPRLTPQRLRYSGWNAGRRRRQHESLVVQGAAGDRPSVARGGSGERRDLRRRRVQRRSDAQQHGGLYAGNQQLGPKAPLPSPRGSPAGVGVISGKLYVAGGTTGTSGVTNTLYAYTAATNTWVGGPP